MNEAPEDFPQGFVFCNFFGSGVVLCAEGRYNRRKEHGFAKGDNIMNENHLHQIFENYIDRFEEFNSGDRKKPSEYYKWEMPGPFKDCMKVLMNAEKREQVIAQIDEIKKITHDFIDSGKTLPLAGLAKFADEYGEWKTIQEMFQKLYADDGRDSQEKIGAFLNQCRVLERKHGLGGTYKSDYRSVTVYLFLYDPDNNYIYKPTHAQDFQDCIEFYDDFGVGDNVNLKTYYRMCDELVEKIRDYPRLKELDDIRLALIRKDNREAYQDTKLHILAYDIIYCCSSYDLFRGISFERLTTTERKVRWEKQQKALELLEKLKNAQEQKKNLDAAMEKVEQYFSVGQKVAYKSFGKAAQTAIGTIVKRGNDSVTIDFGDGNVKSVGLIIPIVNGYIRPQEADENDYANIVAILKKKSVIENNLSQIGKDFAPYSDYI